MEVKVLDYGFVRLVDTMPREDLDESIVQAARVSYGDGTSTSRSNKGLIRYLLRHWHTTPFEMVEFKFHLKMPIFVARQHLRHRTASVNEMSARYSVVPDEFFVPDQYRKQSQVNKQSSEGVLDDSEATYEPKKVSEVSFEVYDKLLREGCCRELARCHLPQSTYTEFYWKINLHNLMHYLQLRLEPGAQTEIRVYADAIYKILWGLVPDTMDAFMDFRLNMVQFSGKEVAFFQLNLLTEGEIMSSDLSLGEKREFVEKLKKLSIIKV
jgi:thymidylate synthase (FAD)